MKRINVLPINKLAIFSLGVTVVLALPLLSLVSAQSEQVLSENDMPAVIEDVPGLRAEFVQKSQNPGSKEAEFEMILTSTLDADRAKITWTIDGVSNFVDSKKAEQNFTIKNGGKYTLPIKIKPVGKGVTELFGKVEAFKADTTYIVTVRKNFATNASGEILPLTDEYNQAKNMNMVILIFQVVLGFVVVVGGIFLGFRYLMKYLKRDDVKSFDSKVKSIK